jgi:pimeloyl-ACP methyl ester carboxylesterase
VSVPVRLIAGSDDCIVDTKKHSARLHLELGASTFRVVPGCGHMVHHAAPEEVTTAIHGMRKMRLRTVCAPVRRHWLEIGEAA